MRMLKNYINVMEFLAFLKKKKKVAKFGYTSIYEQNSRNQSQGQNMY